MSEVMRHRYIFLSPHNLIEIIELVWGLWVFELLGVFGLGALQENA